MGRPLSSGLRGRGPAAGLVLEDEGVKEGLGGFLFVLVEGGEGLELEPELFVGAALVLLEHETVRGNPERAGEIADAVQGGLSAAGLVAVDLDEGELDQLGQGLLGEAGHSRRSRLAPRGCGDSLRETPFGRAG